MDVSKPKRSKNVDSIISKSVHSTSINLMMAQQYGKMIKDAEDKDVSRIGRVKPMKMQ